MTYRNVGPQLLLKIAEWREVNNCVIYENGSVTIASVRVPTRRRVRAWTSDTITPRFFSISATRCCRWCMFTMMTVIMSNRWSAVRRTQLCYEIFAGCGCWWSSQCCFRCLSLLLSILAGIIIITSDKGGGKCFCPCSFVCLSVC